ncbi:MAG TPA: ABC transporter permease [Tepidisphaeraceae bacterium]
MNAIQAPVLPIASDAPGALANVFTIARRELRDAIRSRWFVLYTLAFAALGVGVSYVSAVSVGGSGFTGFGRTSAGLINLVLLIVPLMSLTAGAGTIASDRERGMLSYLLAQPVSRWEVLIGKYIGLALALTASICLGFGLCALVLARQESLQPGAVALLAARTSLLAMAMLSVGMLISVLARKTSVATGTSVFLWFTLVFISDLGLMAAALTLRLRIETMFGLALINPLQVFKFWSLDAVGASLDVLGPAGLWASQTLGGWLGPLMSCCLIAWIALPLLVAIIVFNRRLPV